jgi:ElaB/YqjD/DUF883 family membrane-anchored ribosome-binding protein
MEILLIVAVIVITLAVVAQAGALIAMYLMSRQLSVKAESLMNDSRRLIPPLESVLSNLKTAMEDLTQTAKITREQALLIQDIIGEAQDTVRKDIDEVRERVVGKVDKAGDVFMRPIREWSAIALGVTEGIRTYFRRKKTKGDKEYPAA